MPSVPAPAPREHVILVVTPPRLDLRPRERQDNPPPPVDRARTKARPPEIRRRRQEVADLYLGGLTQAAIAQRFGVHQSQICRDLKWVKAQWREECIEMVDAMYAEDLAIIKEVSRRAWECWDASRKDKVTVRVKEMPGFVVTTTRTEKRYGNPIFLDRILECIKRKSELLDLENKDISEAEVLSRIRREEVAKDVSAEMAPLKAREAQPSRVSFAALLF
jgi:hypothetical protein